MAAAASHSSLSSLPPAQWIVRFHDTAFSGASVARDWLPVLQKLTRVHHLHEGIVNSWGSLLGKNRGSGQWTTRWCPCCLEETQAAGRPYLHLAWSIGLVEACPVQKPMQADEEFGVHKVLRAAAECYFSGSMVRLSEWIGMNKSTVHGWLNGTVIPEMGRLAELAIKLRMSLRDIVTGRLDDLPGSLEVGALRLENRERAEPRADEKREAL